MLKHYIREKLQIWLLLFETLFYGIEIQLPPWQMSGNTWMTTLKVCFFSLTSITNKCLIYIWNMATRKAINPNTQHAAKCFPVRASTCSVMPALCVCWQTHSLLVLSMMSHLTVSQQPGIGGHWEQFAGSIGNYRGSTKFVLKSE